MASKNVRKPIIKIPESELKGFIETAVKAEMYKGPLPHPEHLKKYEAINPGAAKQLFDMFEKQTIHRMKLENTVISSNVSNERRGQWFGFIISMTVIVGGFFLIFLDKDILGISAILASLATLTGLFLYGKSKSKRELQSKS